MDQTKTGVQYTIDVPPNEHINRYIFPMNTKSYMDLASTIFTFTLTPTQDTAHKHSSDIMMCALTWRGLGSSYV